MSEPSSGVALAVYLPTNKASSSAAPPAARLPFELVDASDTDGAKVRVIISTLAGGYPSGFTAGHDDDDPYVLDVADSDQIYACVSWDVSGGHVGLVTSRTLGNGATVPTDDATTATFYQIIGAVAVADGKCTPENARYGPIDAICYRNWFANPASFSVAWQADANPP